MFTGFSRSRKLLSLVLFAEVALSGLAAGLPAAAAAEPPLAGMPYAADAVRELQAAGLLSVKTTPGSTGFRFAPKDETTREEAAKVLAALLNRL